MALFALIHGGWHGPWVWDKVTPLLTARAHEVATPKLAVDEPGTWAADSEALEAELRDRIDETVLVGTRPAGTGRPWSPRRAGRSS